MDAEQISWQIRNALLGEVYTTPKPGLVDRIDNGAHKDMTRDSFLLSTEAIVPFLVKMYETGVSFALGDTFPAYKDCFSHLRELGREAEEKMLRATGRINTHRGIIFSMGLLCCAAATVRTRTPSLNKERFISAVQNEMTLLCRDTLEEEITQLKKHDRYPDIFSENNIYIRNIRINSNMNKNISNTDVDSNINKNIKKNENISNTEMNHRCTHGVQLLRKEQVQGVRGEAIHGFPGLFAVAYPALCRFEAFFSQWLPEKGWESPLGAENITPPFEKNTDDDNWRQRYQESFAWERENLRNVYTLLSIMAVLEDSNVLYRGNRELLGELQKKAAEILQFENYGSKKSIEKIHAFNQWCIQTNLSPGGAADLLADAILLKKFTET